MKYLITLSFMLTLAVSAQSQWWFDAGIKGSYGPTLMYDQNVFDDAFYKHNISTGTSIGGRVGLNYGYHVGLSLEYAGATSNQDFEYNGDIYNTFKWKHNDISTLFRYSGNGAYVEVGAKFSNVKEVELDNVEDGISDATAYFNENYTSGIFGFGSYLMGSELLTLNMGIRLHWGFTDMVNEAGKEQGYPIYLDPTEPLKDPSKKTLATAAQLQLELNYAFGRFSKEACHDRWKLILFQ
jgi:hypothetical protein